MKCYWNPQNTPAELYSMLPTLAEEYPVAENPAEANIRFVKVDDPETLSVNPFFYCNPSRKLEQKFSDDASKLWCQYFFDKFQFHCSSFI